MNWDFPTAFKFWDEAEKSAIARVIESGQFTMAHEVRDFEIEFAEFHGRKHAIMTNSGSSANLLAVACLFHKRRNPLRRDDDQLRGRQAIVPALAWSTTYSPLVQHGLKLVLADVDETWNAPIPQPFPDPPPRLMVVCSILGNPCHGAEWAKMAEESGAYLIHDNCESFGAIDEHGVYASNYGLLSTHSLFYSHQLSAVEGGIVMTDDEELANLCRILRAHGWTRDVWHDPLGNPASPPRFDLEYEFTHFGWNLRGLEMHAAVAREQLRKAGQFQEARLENWQWFEHRVARYELPITLPKMRGTPNPFGLHFTCDRETDRAPLVAALRANGIDARLPTGGSFKLHRYAPAYCASQETPNADAIHRNGLFLGNAPFTLKKEIDMAVEVMRKVF